MKTYKKGSRAERELIDLFSTAGFSVVRAAGSGVSSLSPDILAFRKGKNYAFECKAKETDWLGVKKKQFDGLLEWERNTGITSLVAWKRNRKPWKFIPLSIFKENAESYSITWKTASLHSYSFEELI